MARVLGFTVGELRGKLGGNVYSRNKYGPYARAYTIPVDPSTVAQNRARALFGSASSSYHGLTPTQKSQWTSFGSTTYQPKHQTASEYSGFNAFVGMTNAATNAEAMKVEAAITLLVGGGTTTEAYTSFINLTTPPASPLLGNIKTDGAPAPMTLVTATLNIDSLAASISILPISPPANGISGTLDANSMPFGFGVYMSRGMEQAGMSPVKTQETMLGAIAPFTLSGENDDVSTGFVASFTSPVDPEDKQTWPVAGETVEITVYQIGVNGQFNLIGKTEITTTGT